MVTQAQRRRESTIKLIVPNLRRQFPQLSNRSDEHLANAYESFELSEDFGNNNENFLKWVDLPNVD